MKKDVIYIDVEDDITAIIGKVKGSAEKVVALVPPKRVGVLQSAVNLRLLARASAAASKRLVLITNSTPLISLAASAKIPVAKNLQSKPELAEIAALEIDDGEDIIDGAQLPIGELERTADLSADNISEHGVNGSSGVNDVVKVAGMGAAAANAVQSTAGAPKSKRSGTPKVPDFNVFRKKLVLFGGLGVLLIGFLVWAIFFAPRATIVIAATTTNSSVSGRVTTDSGSATNFETKTIRSVSQELKKTATVDFEATGREERGDSATGTMTLTRSVGGSVTVPAGSSFSSGEYTFVSNEAIVVPGASLEIGSSDIVPGTAEVGVTATQIGSEYNLSARSYVTDVDGVSARGGQMSGGSKEEVKLVTAGDVQAAKEKLVAQDDDAAKKEIAARFGDGVRVISSSFVATPADPVSTPDVGDVAEDGMATLTSEVTYQMVGIAESELADYLKQALESKIDNKDVQQVYNTGDSEAQLIEYASAEMGGSVAIRATGQIGPRIDETKIKEDSLGKQYGEVQQTIESIAGIREVDVKFWPFWVRTVPSDIERVTVEFNLENNGS